MHLYNKGQITLFIIIGIVILISVGTVSYIRSTASKESLEVIPPGTETRYEGEQEIRAFVESCLRPIALQGLEIMRLQAGYIDIPAGTQTLLVKDKENNEQIKVVDGRKKVVIDRAGQGNEAPFWVTKGGIAIPSKEFMESQLEDYITSELDECVGDFSQFKEMGYVIERGTLTTGVSFVKSTWIRINLPLAVTISETTYEISEFNFEIPIDMELIYNIASDLALYEALYSYLEGFSLDLIEKYSWKGGSKEKPAYLPPKRFTDTSFDCNQVTWTLNEVKDDLKDNYNQNIQYLKIANTHFDRITRPTAIQQGVFDSYIKDFFTESYPTIKADYVYDKDWFFNLNILPKSGSMIKPDKTSVSGIPMVPSFCVFKYRFNYFMDFPYMLKVTEEKSANIDPVSNTFKREAGYEFHAPLWVYVCGNQKRECKGIQEEPNLPESNQEETHFCDDNQKLSGNITVAIKDSVTSESLKDVDVYWFSDDMNSCYMGRTDSTGSFSSKFPFCTGCLIDLTKQGYPKKRIPLTIYDYQNYAVEFKLDPFYNLTVRAKFVHMPTFVRSWYETNGFANAAKMKALAAEYNYPVNASLAGASLNDLRNNRDFMGVLIGESSLNSDNNDMALITGTGLNNFYYSYPDAGNRKLIISPGVYSNTLLPTATVDIRASTYDGGDDDDVTIQGLGRKEGYPIGPETSYNWNLKSDDIQGKNSITFYSLVEHRSNQLNPGNWKDIDDLIMRQDGTMRAELKYRGDRDPVSGTCENMHFVDIDGSNTRNFDSSGCTNVYNIEIKKDQYAPYILPTLS